MKQLWMAAFAAGLFAAGPLADAGVLMYYDFDSESGGTVSDLSGNGQDGTLNGTSTLTADAGGHTGLPGDKALSFFPDNFFTATSTVSPGSGDWSVSFWYKTAATGTIAILDHSQSPDNTSGYQMFGTAGGGQVAIWDDDAGSHLATGAGLASGDLGGNVWRHVALTVDRTADVGTVYIDGAVKDTFSTAVLHDMTIGLLQLGTFNNGQVDSTGFIDDFAILDSALSQAEVVDIRDGAPIPEPASLALLGIGALAMIRRKRPS